MGALYEDVEKFFGDIFALYGRFLARYPVVFIILSLLTSVLLGMGLLNIKYENDVEKLYAPMGSPAFKDRAHLAELFPDTTREAYYPYQLIYHGTFGELLFYPKADNNILNPVYLSQITELHSLLSKITLDKDGRGLHFEDLCSMRYQKCVVDGELILQNIDSNGCYNKSMGFPFAEDAMGYKVDLRDIVSGIGEDEVTDNGETDECLKAKIMRLRFNLKHDTKQQRELSLLWELKFLEVLSEYSSDTMEISYSVSESLDIELANHLGKDTKFFSLTIVIMVLYATFVSSGGNWVSTRTLLAQAGILAALLAILASFGLLSMCGMIFVDICGVMPFLILGVGVDDMFILMSGWRRTDLRLSIEDRMADTFRSSAISVTITSLTDLLAFCIGATSPFLSVKNFCIYAGVAVLFCYLNHLTFFSGCMVLHARRVVASRHCLTCMRTKSRHALEEEKKSRKEIFCCHGQPPKKVGEDDSLCEKIPNTMLPRFLLQWPVKIIIIVLFFLYLGVSIWGASNIKTGLKLENVVPDSSYLSKYLQTERKYFQYHGPPIMFVITNPVQYDSHEIQDKIQDIIKQSRNSGYIDKTFAISWLDSYLKFRKDQYRNEEFIDDVRLNFLPKFPQYVNDIKFNEENDLIVASRVYVRSKHYNESTAEGDMMTKMREIASNSNLPCVVYSPEFIHYEHYVSILKNTLLSVGVAVIGMIFIALMFIPHPISITCVTFTMVTIVLGMFGFMYFWNLELSAITNVQIILSVGFCVDFTVHISHAFMTATGKNRNERVVAALEKVGIPILNGAFSSILGVLILAFANSYVFRSFFKTMLLVISLGLAHALLLLPVILSFIGPRRTSKPRVFIPVAANWSSQGLGGFFSPRRHPPGEDTADSEGHCPPKGSSHEDIELMTLESPDESKRLLHPVPEIEECEDRNNLTSYQQTERTLLDKTPEEEHYKEPVDFTDIQIVVDPKPPQEYYLRALPLERILRSAAEIEDRQASKERPDSVQGADITHEGAATSNCPNVTDLETEDIKEEKADSETSSADQDKNK